jgi:hypothetical protein
MTPEMLFKLADARGISYQRVAASTKPQWPLEAVSLAMGDMWPINEREKYYSAFAWRWARDQRQYSIVWASLLIATAERALAEHWPRRICGELYIEKLVELALLEEHFWWLLRKHDLYAAMVGIEVSEKDRLSGITPESIWDRRFSKRYESVRHQLEVWCGTVHSHMAARMRESENEESIACA